MGEQYFKKTITISESDDLLLKKLKAENRMTEGKIISYCLHNYADSLGVSVEQSDDDNSQKLTTLIVQNKELKEQLYHTLNLLNSLSTALSVGEPYISARNNPHEWLQASKKELADRSIAAKTKNI